MRQISKSTQILKIQKVEPLLRYSSKSSLLSRKSLFGPRDKMYRSRSIHSVIPPSTNDKLPPPRSCLYDQTSGPVSHSSGAGALHPQLLMSPRKQTELPGCQRNFQQIDDRFLTIVRVRGARPETRPPV